MAGVTQALQVFQRVLAAVTLGNDVIHIGCCYYRVLLLVNPEWVSTHRKTLELHQPQFSPARIIASAGSAAALSIVLSYTFTAMLSTIASAWLRQVRALLCGAWSWRFEWHLRITSEFCGV